MSDQVTNDSPVNTRRRETPWDALAAIIASLVGLLALVVAGYTAWIQRQQVRAQVWPYVIGGMNGARFQFVWINKGVGPAIVHSVQVRVNGKPQHDWSSVREALALQPFEYDQSFLNGNVLSPGETLDWIRFKSQAEYGAFLAATHRTNMSVEVCYCSTLGDCWQTRFASSGRTQVDRCERLPEKLQFRD